MDVFLRELGWAMGNEAYTRLSRQSMVIIRGIIHT